MYVCVLSDLVWRLLIYKPRALNIFNLKTRKQSLMNDLSADLQIITDLSKSNEIIVINFVAQGTLFKSCRMGCYRNHWWRYSHMGYVTSRSSGHYGMW